MKKKLTVFTPTFNRKTLLPRLYQSLCQQTSKDFVWMIIDDGSTDGTRQLVELWQQENKVEIVFHYKKNGGMHTGHNLAYQKIDTELNVCIDSDDCMPDDAVEKILATWDGYEDKSSVAGIIGLDADKSGNVIGTKNPSEIKIGNLTDLYKKYKATGDKKLVLRTDVVRKYPLYPEYDGEKLVPLGILYLLIGQDYNLIYSNDVYCIVEYQAEGSSGTILKQYKQSPRGFGYARRIQIKYAQNVQDSIKSYVHLISSAIFAKDISLLWKGVNPLKSVLLLPIGILLNLWIRSKH